MYNHTTPQMPADKIVRLFIIQAIGSFVSKDYDSGLHYLNEIKSSYAEYMTQINPSLKILVKEIIQSLDMFTPGATSDSFSGVNETQSTQNIQTEEVFHNPAQELTSRFRQANKSTDDNSDEAEIDVTIQKDKSVTAELQDLLNRRRELRKKRKQA